MLLSTVSCGETTPTNDTNPSADTSETTPPTPEETTADTDNLTDHELRQLIPDNLPDTTFGGKSFRVMTYNNSYGDDSYEIVSEELTGDACNDAVYNRNLDIESRFDVVIQCTTESSPQTYINTMVKSGLDEQDLFGFYEYVAYYPINAKSSYNWLEVPHVDLEQPWHNSLANDGATINNKLYAICSDYSISSMTFTYAFFFNIGMMENYGYPSSDLYSMVKEGTWTLDQVMKMTETMYEDTNGNGEADGEDIYGFGYSLWNPVDVWLTAFNQKLVTVTDDNTIEINFLTDRTITIVEKLNEWHHNNTGFTILSLNTPYGEEKLFLNNQLVMAPLRFYTAYNVLRDMESSYSMLPYPKLDETQDTYYTTADDRFTIFTIPITAYNNLDFIGTIYEALCAESYKTVYPEYYDTALKGKYSAEPETAEMVDLIMAGRNFDFSLQFGESHFQRLPYMLRDFLRDNNNDIASSFKKIEKSMNKTVKNKLLPLYLDEE